MLNDPEEMSVCSLHKVRPLWMISVNLNRGSQELLGSSGVLVQDKVVGTSLA